MDLGQHVNGTRSVLAGRMPLPPGTYANASLDIEAFAFTVAGTYRALERDNANIDVFAGGRLLDATVKLDWDFNSDVVGTLRSGSSEVGHSSWDGIVGAKGRVYFGERKQWFVPWYVDAGTGATDLTWNASAGLGYAMRWGEVFVDVSPARLRLRRRPASRRSGFLRPDARRRIRLVTPLTTHGPPLPAGDELQQ